ncbi:MAG: 4Fe-4S ferredoxin [Methanoculleus sp. SDB]|nr:MAG: 4Fe-4S ferredoxin [Methanoculleus sp. SDB]
MTSNVYFADFKHRTAGESTVSMLDRLFAGSGCGSIIEEGDLVAVKVHFGERGCDTYTSPVHVRSIVNAVRAAGGRPFLTDTNTLYSGGRRNAPDHIETAIAHGFAYAVAGASILIADGISGGNARDVRIRGRHFDRVIIAGDIVEADAMIVVSHFKGHIVAGFGGAIKNLGMGCATRAGKHEQHSVLQPVVLADLCTGCGTCSAVCPENAVAVSEAEPARITQERCVSCGQCVDSCPEEAMVFDWEQGITPFTERMVEYALGAIAGKREKTGFINFAVNITPHCDCAPWSDPPIVPDIGVLASCDPVAIDTASLDLVNLEAGCYKAGNGGPCSDTFTDVWPHTNGELQLSYAETIGLGTRSYELIRI